MAISRICKVLTMAAVFTIVATEALALPVMKRMQIPGAKHDVVYHGANVSESGKTWQYVVQISSEAGSCTGFFIDHDTLVTAAHCFNSTVRKELYVSLFKGSEVDVYDSAGASEYRLMIHSGYDFRNNSAQPGVDVAVVVFKKQNMLPWDRTAGVIIHSGATTSIGIGDMALMVGAGKSDLNAGSGTLRHVNATVSGFPATSGLELEASSGGGICKGDSGGPALWRSARTGLTNYYIMGIASGMGGIRLNNDCSTGAQYTTINAKIGDWISKAQTRLQAQVEPLREADRQAEEAREQEEIRQAQQDEADRKAAEARKFPHIRLGEEAASLQKIADSKAAELLRAQENLKKAQEDLRKAQEAENASSEEVKKARAAAQAKADEAKKAKEAFDAAKTDVQTQATLP